MWTIHLQGIMFPPLIFRGVMHFSVVFHQPVWNICSSNWIHHLPKLRGENSKKMFETATTQGSESVEFHHLVSWLGTPPVSPGRFCLKPPPPHFFSHEFLLRFWWIPKLIRIHPDDEDVLGGKLRNSPTLLKGQVGFGADSTGGKHVFFYVFSNKVWRLRGFDSQ